MLDKSHIAIASEIITKKQNQIETSKPYKIFKWMWSQAILYNLFFTTNPRTRSTRMYKSSEIPKNKKLYGKWKYLQKILLIFQFFFHSNFIKLKQQIN